METIGCTFMLIGIFSLISMGIKDRLDNINDTLKDISKKLDMGEITVKTDKCEIIADKGISLLNERNDHGY